jgi:hypothetical protein
MDLKHKLDGSLPNAHEYGSLWLQNLFGQNDSALHSETMFCV